MQSQISEDGTPLQLTRIAQPYHVTLSRGMKGVYAWEVSVYSETVDDAMVSLEFAEKELKAKYGEQQEK